MSGNYSGAFFPACSILFSILIIIIYFSKKRVDLIENKAYAAMLICTFFDSILAITLQLMVLNGMNETIIMFINIINKLDFICLIFYSSLLFIYTTIITYKIDNSSTFSLKKIVLLFDIFIILIMLFCKIEIISSGEYYSIAGIAPMITFSICGFYIILSILVTLFNLKKIDKRHIPILVTTFLIIMILLLFIINPYIVVISISLTFVNYIMYFTIENPDLKMVRELELAKNQAEKANRAKSDFLSSMSHEIRTPLNAIVCLSEIINSSDDLKEIHEDSKDIVSASHTLLEIVNGVLDISRIEADKTEIVNINYNPIEEFKELAKLIETRIGEKDIKFRTNFALDIPNTLYGDKGKIKQIITNLLSNAVKYTEKGFIDFDVKCINNNDSCKLTISVKDTGRGIKKEQIDKLFTKFNRLDSDMNTTIEGTGLGLAITKALVEMMGGKVVVDSTYGEGSKFTVFLEQKIVNDNLVLEKEKTNINQKYDNINVLIVDDNKLNIKVASKVFKEIKIKVESVDSGYECIDKIKNGGHYDIIFMDIMMPKMDGVETLKYLKELKNFNTPVVALTADAMEGSLDKYINAGFSEYIIKPIDKDRLNEVLNKTLNNNDLNDNKEVSIKESNVIPITDEDIKKLNNLDEDEKIMDNKNNIEYLKENDIDIDSSLELLGDIDMYNETLNIFIEENKTRIPRIEKNKNDGNMKDYSIDVHALKSDCKYLGFKRLAELSYDHELKSKENDTKYVNEHFSELMNEYERINKIISEYSK